MKLKLAVLGLLFVAPPALSQTTTTYTYDSLGRVVKVAPSSGTPTCYKYDRVDNFRTVSATGGCSEKSGPVANADYFASCYTNPWFEYYNPIGNDEDWDLPADKLTITSVTGTGSGNFSVVNFGGNDILQWSGSATPGIRNFTYYIQDNQGATSSATMQIEFILNKPANPC